MIPLRTSMRRAWPAWIALSFAGSVVAVSTRVMAEPAAGPTCDMCHRESASPPDPADVDCNCDFFCKDKYYTKPEGMHGNFPCTTCHAAAQVGSYPHTKPVTVVDCASACHSKQAAVLEATVHTSEALHGVGMTHPIVGEHQSACLTCHPPHAGKGYGEAQFVEYNRRSRPCLACHVDERSAAPQVHGYEHPLHVFDAEGSRWGALTTIPLFDEHGRVVEDGQTGALTCNSCHSNHGPDAGPEHLRRSGWQKACAACHGADSLALYRYFHKPERRAHVVVQKAVLEEGQAPRPPCAPGEPEPEAPSAPAPETAEPVSE